MTPVTRKAALATGATKYFTGKPCKRGHVAVRRTVSGHCVECVRVLCRAPAGRAATRRANVRRHEAKLAHARVARKTLVGHVSQTYNYMAGRVLGKRREYRGLAIMSRADFVAWSVANKQYARLYNAWVASEYARPLTPSIDRIDTMRGYVAGNVQWLTISQNSRKACLWRHHGVNPITKAAA